MIIKLTGKEIKEVRAEVLKDISKQEVRETFSKELQEYFDKKVISFFDINDYAKQRKIDRLISESVERKVNHALKNIKIKEKIRITEVSEKEIIKMINVEKLTKCIETDIKEKIMKKLSFLKGEK